MAETGTLARPYARAIFELARDDGSLSAWSQALRTAADVVSDPAASAFLSRRELDGLFAHRLPAVGLRRRRRSAKVLGSERGRNLLRLLAENRRLEVLPEISTRFDALKARAENTVKVQLVTAAGVEASRRRTNREQPWNESWAGRWNWN